MKVNPINKCDCCNDDSSVAIIPKKSFDLFIDRKLMRCYEIYGHNDPYKGNSTKVTITFPTGELLPSLGHHDFKLKLSKQTIEFTGNVLDVMDNNGDALPRIRVGVIGMVTFS